MPNPGVAHLTYDKIRQPMSILDSFSRLTVWAVLDILAVAFVIYQLLMIVRGTRAAHILGGIVTVVAVYRLPQP